MDYYEVLGLRSDASREEIRAAYRILVARAHPDVNPAPDAERQTAFLNEAWSVLRDPSTRASYDAAGLATSAALRCQRCGSATPNLRFVVFARARGAGLPRNDGAMLCARCRKSEARGAAFSSFVRGGYATRRGRRTTFGAIARDLRGGKVDTRTSAALLRQIGFVYARENKSSEALTALEAVLGFGDDPAVARVVARLREAGAVVGAPTIAPAASPAPRRRSSFSQRPLFLAAAMVLLVVLAGGWFGVTHRPSPLSVAPSYELARNVDPALRDDLRRLASVVRTRYVPPDRAVFLFDLPSDKSFALAYDVAVMSLPAADRERNPWVVTLETTSEPSDAVEVAQSDDYVLARGCAPGRCADGFVSVAYNGGTHAVAGAAYYDGKWHEFGSKALTDRAMAVLSVARNRLPLARRLALDPAERLVLRRFVSEVRSSS
ncbi:MAG: DnaJ domain-containing protein [Candidatus Eremiobacteraeota bacterium]|nr:DnaJ domain-containing protein [Candidatus Eremiobacteraeota bacterium]